MSGRKIVTEESKIAVIEKHSTAAFCAKCPCDCPLKELRSLDRRDKCVIPNERAKAVLYSMPIMSEDMLTKYSMEALMTLKKCAETDGNVRDLKVLHDAILKQKEIFYPSATKNLNLNMNVNLADDIVKRVFATGEEEDE